MKQETNYNQPFHRTFVLPLHQLHIDPSMTASEGELAGLRETAEAMRLGAGVGQLHPILVIEKDRKFVLAAGLRRALAMRNFADEMGFVAALARRIPEDFAAPLRELEKQERRNALSFDTCRMTYELATGSYGRPKIEIADLAAAMGRSSIHVRSVVRFYKRLPAEVRAAWQVERDPRHALRLLDVLERVSRQGD
jgi:hypothetical protein